MGSASASMEHVRANVPATAAPLFAGLLPVVWDVAAVEGVDPVVVAAQFAKESGWAHYRGQVPVTYHNPCGLKRAGATGDLPEDHARFETWSIGFLAQCQHLEGYAGHLPKALIVDPRWSSVAPGTARHGSAPTVDQLGDPLGWAPSETYGVEVESIARRLRGEAT